MGSGRWNSFLHSGEDTESPALASMCLSISLASAHKEMFYLHSALMPEDVFKAELSGWDGFCEPGQGGDMGTEKQPAAGTVSRSREQCYHLASLCSAALEKREKFAIKFCKTRGFLPHHRK